MPAGPRRGPAACWNSEPACVIYRALENIQRAGGGVLGGDLVEGAIDNFLGDGLLAAAHYRVDQPRNQRAVKFRVFDYRSSDCLTASGHVLVKALKV